MYRSTRAVYVDRISNHVVERNDNMYLQSIKCCFELGLELLPTINYHYDNVQCLADIMHHEDWLQDIEGTYQLLWGHVFMKDSCLWTLYPRQYELYIWVSLGICACVDVYTRHLWLIDHYYTHLLMNSYARVLSPGPLDSLPNFTLFSHVSPHIIESIPCFDMY